MSYKTIVGLEIHVELSTKTKAFCSCENIYGAEANTKVCPVCLGLPGAIPVLNEEAVKYAIMSGIALNCEINKKSKFDRKNYFYPDLTKGYQITQDDMPICKEGYIEIELENCKKKIGIQKIQLEEDTGKSLHTENDETLIDYNRCGVPLIEIVSKPDMNSGVEAKLFLEKLKNNLIYIGVSDCKMEEGSLRCDVNVNVKDEETGRKSAIAEIKNLNSFRAVEKAIEYEVNRQIELLENGEEEIKTTRRWDDVENKTVLMRVKYTAQDYRFVPDGDLAPIVLNDEYIEEIKNNLPELPEFKKERFIKEFGLSEYDADVLTSSKEISKYYEEVVSEFDDYNLVSNWIMTEILRRIDNKDDFTLPFTSEDFRNLLIAIKEGKINNNAGKKVLREMFETGKKPIDIIKEKGLEQTSDSSEIEKIVEEVLQSNAQSIEDYKAGKDRAFGFLVGQVMKASKGKANPQIVNQLLMEKLNK